MLTVVPPPAVSGISSRQEGGCHLSRDRHEVIEPSFHSLSPQLAQPGTAQALPQDGTVTAGTGSISTAGSSMTVNQSTQKLIVDWQSFGIASGESVQFIQPSSSAVALNRVLGNNSSEIYGSLTANGQVFLINPNGILFAPTAQVSVGSLVASTLDISNDDFLAGNYVFEGEGGSITNQGNLTAAEGGVIALLAPEVRNEGVIVAQAGSIGLGAGTRIRLSFGSGFDLEVEESAVNALIENHHALRADGGLIILSASAHETLLAGVINNTGVIEANGVSEEGGVIRLTGGFQSLGGSISANGTSGGDIRVDATNVNQYSTLSADGSAGTGGTVRIDAASIVQPVTALVSANGTTTGGRVHVQGRYSVLTSGTLSANGGTQGGSVELLGDDLQLAAAKLTATGANGGGSIHVGGDFQGIGSR
ncbi:MAG: filamentous hemagglutinin N-terminal protein, partial [Moraxellaceae bacterium]|nr:filamentous hemagglutinin N-terminal protein [Moraxellaceae bacterium]